MNEGQRRYAMEQYNLSLVRRGKYFTPPSSPIPGEPDNSNQHSINNIPPPIHQSAAAADATASTSSAAKRPADSPSKGSKKAREAPATEQTELMQVNVLDYL
ncbi:hypothetical protein HHI36_007580 [Cryptolaemus montrouzieri]|uniref:Uncharacterized protein n=1 Tax=Cryptolaemus montrouzieri TaxID=559131 RepID=A0ABD2MQ45_9CUCU